MLVAFETNLQVLARHFTDVLDDNRETITTADGVFAFKRVEYGEPSTILEWPLLSVQPIVKRRDISTLRKYELGFEIHLLLFHGEVSKTHKIQEETHRRAEAVELFIMSDRKWNFIDSTDKAKDRVIQGTVTTTDHPFVMMGETSLWSASRLVLEGLSQEAFQGDI